MTDGEAEKLFAAIGPEILPAHRKFDEVFPEEPVFKLMLENALNKPEIRKKSVK